MSLDICDGPTDALPGSHEKIAVLRWRASRNLPLWHPADSDGPAVDKMGGVYQSYAEHVGFADGAERIIRYLESFGGVATPEEISEATGVGLSMIGRIVGKSDRLAKSREFYREDRRAKRKVICLIGYERD